MNQLQTFNTNKAMKKTLSIFALAAAVLCSCDKNADCIPCQEQENQEPAMLNVSLGFEDEPQTRAVTAYTTAQDQTSRPSAQRQHLRPSPSTSRTTA